MQAALRLSLNFDPAALKADVDRLIELDWINHFDTAIYSGDWSGLALRGPAGAVHPIQALHSAPGTTEFEDQSPLLLCPYLRQVMQTLPCTLTSVRLLRLGPKAAISEHTDHGLGYEFGEVRLHIPVITNSDVDFRVDGRRIEMQAGELWYIDAARPHAVVNQGDQERIHFVLDCQLNHWLRAEIETADTSHDGSTALATLPLKPPRIVDQPNRPIGPVTPVVEQIIAFIRDIGIPVEVGNVASDTFLPGIQVIEGGIRVDPGRLLYPGDLLHEAGHIAVTAASERLGLDDHVSIEPADEMMAIAWSWAALSHLQLDPKVVFHDQGYKGDAQWLIDTFSGGVYLALPMLQWIGVTADPERARQLNADPYPHMLRWLRE